MARLPWFPFYPLDFIADRKVASMSLAARGAYITLLCYAWQETPKGTLPKDALEDVVSGLIEPDQRAVWACFTEKEGRFVQKRMCAEVERISEISEVKRAAANARWHANGMHMHSTSNARPMQNDANTSHHIHNTSHHIEDLLLSAEPPKKTKKAQMPDLSELEEYVISIGMTKTDAQEIRDHWLTTGFRTKTGSIQDWQAACRTWKRNKEKYAPVIASNGSHAPTDKLKFVTHDKVANWCARKGWTKLTEIAWGKLMGGSYYGRPITNEVDFNAAMSAIYEETEP